MDNPGIKNLGDYSLTAAVVNSVITLASDAQGINQPYLDSLDGMETANLQLTFNYGSGGTKVTVFVQTSIDQGASWNDVWCATFTTASAKKLVNVSGLTPKTTAVVPTDGALADDTVVDGMIGTLWRAKYTSTGTYGGNTSLSARLNAR